MQRKPNYTHVYNSPILHARGLVECPDGYRLIKGYFTERDGTKEDAYISIKGGPIGIDYLKGGESCGVAFTVGPIQYDKNQGGR